MKQAEFGQEENIPVPGGWKELLNYLKDFSIRWNADVEKENFRLRAGRKGTGRNTEEPEGWGKTERGAAKDQ